MLAIEDTAEATITIEQLKGAFNLIYRFQQNFIDNRSATLSLLKPYGGFILFVDRKLLGFSDIPVGIDAFGSLAEDLLEQIKPSALKELLDLVIELQGEKE